MKSYSLISLFVLLLTNAFSQSVPNGMQYQAVARDHKGNVIADSELDLAVTLYSEIDQRIDHYYEIHQVVTNALGLFTVTIGQGEITKGEFSKVPWSQADIWMEVAIQTEFDSEFVKISNSKMLSVPYAFHAATASSLTSGATDRGPSDPSIDPNWAITGNGGTDPLIHRLGTRDRADLVIVTSSVERIRVLSGGDVQIANQLAVGGNVSLNSNVLLNGAQGNTINNGDLTVHGNTNLGGDITVAGNSRVDGDAVFNSNLNTYGVIKGSNTTQSTSINTGAIVTHGGVGIAGNLNIGGDANFGGSTSFVGDIHIKSVTESFNSTSGALIVDGGVGIGKQLNVTGNTLLSGLVGLTNTSESSSLESGALIVRGGAAIHKNLNVGGSLNLGGKLNLTTNSTEFAFVISNMNTGDGDGIEIRLGRTHPAWTGFNYLNVTNPIPEFVDEARSTIEGWIDGDSFRPTDLMKFFPTAYIIGTACNTVNFITSQLNSSFGLPQGIDEFQLVPAITIFPGLDAEIFEIPELVVPAINFPAIDVVPKIPELDCSIFPAYSFPVVSSTDVNNSLSNNNQFLSFKDKDGRELGSVRAESVSNWRSNYFDGVFFTQLMGEVVGIDILGGLMGAITHFTLIADSHNSIGVEYTSGHGDYAEWLERADVNELITTGDVVGVVKGKITKNLNGAEQVMAVSAKPIILGNLPAPGKENDGNKVAFMGQIPVKVMGPVSTGDYIVGNKATPGYAIAVSPSSMTMDYAALTVGRAWEENKKEGPKMINTVIGVDNGNFLQLIKKQQEEIKSMSAKVDELDNKFNQLVEGIRNSIIEANKTMQEQADRTNAELRRKFAAKE